MQEPLLNYPEFDYLAPADFGMGSQVVRPCLGEMELDSIFVYSLARSIDNYRLRLKEKSNQGSLISIESRQLALLRNLNFEPFLIAAIANSLETIVGTRCDSLGAYDPYLTADGESA